MSTPSATTTSQLAVSISVHLAGVVKHYKAGGIRVKAVDGIDLEIPAGSSVAIIGPSGCGKSTLLGLIGGLDVPDSGAVALGNREISRLPERQRARIRREQIGFMFQSDDLLPFLTAAENVALQLALRGQQDAQDRSHRLLAELGLGDHADKLPDQLSGGQRQRVGIARALIHDPGLILADEPTGELDGAASETVLDLLLTAHRQVGATLIVVTHDMQVAQRLERTVKMRDGRLVDAAAQRR